MATLISAANGNLTAATTWGVVDTTSLLNSSASNTLLTTSYVNSSTFTPGAITIDGIAVNVARRASSPTGTITVALDQAGSDVAGTVVAINVSDIQTSSNTTSTADLNRGWYFFKFAAPVTLLAATAYSVKVKTSSSTQVYLYHNATANNWSRMLRTTTTGAPASGDLLYILGEQTGAGAVTTRTVTMDNTSTSLALASCEVGNSGVLESGVSASTAYYFEITTGYLDVKANGIFGIGTSGGRLPASSSFTLKMNGASAGVTQLINRQGGLIRCWGNPITGSNTSPNFWTLLTGNVSAAGTVLTVASTDNWSANDQVVIATTSKTATECEIRTIQSVDSATQVTLSAGVTFAHLGTSPTQAEVMNVGKANAVGFYNILIYSPSATNTACVYLETTASTTMRCVVFQNLGSNTANQRGIDILTTTGTYDFQHCIFRDFTLASAGGGPIALNISGASGHTTSISRVVSCGFYNIYRSAVNTVATSGTQYYQDLVGIQSIDSGTSSGNLFNFADVASEYRSIRAAGCVGTTFNSAAISITELANQGAGVIDGIVVHGNARGGVAFASIQTGSATNVTAWRNDSGTLMGGIRLIALTGFTLSSFLCFGNGNSNIAADTGMTFTRLKSGTLAGDSSFASPYGLRLGIYSSTGAVFSNIYLEDVSFGVASGIYVAHTTCDVGSSFSSITAAVYARNSMFGSTPEFAYSGLSFSPNVIWIFSQKHDQTNGNHRAFSTEGLITLDTTLYRTSSPSVRMAPSTALRRMASSPDGSGILKKVDSGTTLSVSVYVRKSNTGAGDAQTYNGQEIRLIARSNYALGLTADTVIASSTAAANGAWEQLSGTVGPTAGGNFADNGVIEFYLDGGFTGYTTGWFNFDDFS